MSTILMTAYDINPYKGSEAATGWNFLLQIARFNKVVAITRENNQVPIEQYIQEHNIDTSNIELYYYDFPYWLRFWKRGARGSSLYFYLWQMFMPLFVKNQKLKFDIAHNVNFHADAFPTFLWALGKPTIWGPINHNEKIPKEYLHSQKEYVKDRLKWMMKNVNWNIDPFMLLAKRNVNVVIGGNRSVQKRLSIAEHKFIQMSQVASETVEITSNTNSSKVFNVLLVGRFLTIKSFDVALISYDKFYNALNDTEKSNVKLTIIGQGPLEKNLKDIWSQLVSKKSIEFIGWVDKDKMNTYYQDANVFLFPSHEGAGMVVAEAMSHGLPVVCFDNFGPGELIGDEVGIKIPYVNYDESITLFASALDRLYNDKNFYEQLSENAVKRFEDSYTWNAKGLILTNLYKELLI